MQVEVILLEKVGNRGTIGDIIRVRKGFANFLVRFHKAQRATKRAREEFEHKKADLLALAAQKLADAGKVATKLEGTVVQITQQARLDGNLFGSVNNQFIAQELAKLGFKVEKSGVRLPNGALKTTGEHDVVIGLHADVIANIKVKITGSDIA
jgi:large subunit ribosomal protein L9